MASALGRIGPNAVSALVELLADSSELARLGAVLALHQIGPSAQAAVPALTKLESDPADFVRAAAAALKAINVGVMNRARGNEGLTDRRRPLARASRLCRLPCSIRLRF
jgi:HEAT repeat protein